MYTDLLCCYAFTAVQLVFILISIYGFIYGETSSLAKPYDPDHYPCMDKYPYIFFTTPHKNYLYRTVCVSECPDQNTRLLKCLKNSVVTECEINPSVQDLSKSVLTYNCIPINNICVPKTQYYYKALEGELVPDKWQLQVVEVSNIMVHIGWSILITSIACLILFLAVEKQPSLTVWIFAFFSLIIYGAFLYFGLQQILKERSNIPQNQQNLDYEYVKQEQEFQYRIINEYYIMVLTSGLIILFLLGNIKRLGTIQQYLKVGSDFLKTNTLIIGLSFFTVILNILYTSFFIISISSLVAITPIIEEKHLLPFEQVITTTGIRVGLFYMLFSYIWGQGFLMGLIDFIISGVVCDFNRSSNRKQADDNVVQRVYHESIYHFGSIVLGQIIMLITWPITQLFRLFSIDIPDKLQQFSSYNYTLIHLKNDHYIQSGVQAIKLINNEKILHSSIGGLGEQFIYITKFCIASIPSLIIYLTSGSPLATFITFISNLSVSSCFFSIYGTSAESVYMVYLFNQQDDQENKPQCTATFQMFLKIVQPNNILAGI
ncbi:hypothetical protein pb186bvf_011278 [Paramecium bursaria]